MPHDIHFRPPSLMRIMKKNWLLYKKLHRWPGLVISFFLLYFGITGIFLNHRETFSHIDIGRKHLPESYHYINWNNAALKGALNISGDSILIYGAVGIWMTDSTYTDYHCFNTHKALNVLIYIKPNPKLGIFIKGIQSKLSSGI